MLDYLEENDEARRLEKALITVLSEGKVVTKDLGGNANDHGNGRRNPGQVRELV